MFKVFYKRLKRRNMKGMCTVLNVFEKFFVPPPQVDTCQKIGLSKSHFASPPPWAPEDNRADFASILDGKS